MKNVMIEHYDEYNQRRYSDPWVAILNEKGTLDFSKRVGAYTGRYHSGEAGDLYVFEPVEKEIYAYGQKDYRGNNTTKKYVQYINGQFVQVENLLEALAVRDGR